MALKGVKVIELAGLAPAPFCGMILRDHGASVLRIDRPHTDENFDTLSRGKKSLILDFKKPLASSVLTKLCLNADVLIEPFRPGIMEKYNLGPSVLCARNPKLIYARLTGFGQNGPFSRMAGHDINYIAVSGVLSMLGNQEKPSHPINLMGDFAGGGLICALGICLALLNRQNTGKGQVIDANMVEGSAYVSSWLWTTRSPKYPVPLWGQSRGKNILDGGAPFYQSYKTKDDKFMAVGALEPQFFLALIKGLGLSENEYSQFSDWEELRTKFNEIFSSKTQAEWCRIFDFTDACVTPVIPLEEAHEHKHNIENKSFVDDGTMFVPVPAPRLSETPGEVSFIKPLPGQHSIVTLQEAGFNKTEIDSLIKEKVIYTASLKSSLLCAERANYVCQAEFVGLDRGRKGIDCCLPLIKGYAPRFKQLQKKILAVVPEAVVTGAVGRESSFEVSINDVEVYSKLKSGRFPDFEKIVKVVKNVHEGNDVTKI